MQLKAIARTRRQTGTKRKKRMEEKKMRAEGGRRRTTKSMKYDFHEGDALICISEPRDSNYPLYMGHYTTRES